MKIIKHIRTIFVLLFLIIGNINVFGQADTEKMVDILLQNIKIDTNFYEKIHYDNQKVRIIDSLFNISDITNIIDIITYKKEWIIILHQQRPEKYNFILLNIENNNIYKLTSISKNYFLLNDYNDDGIIDFIKVDYRKYGDDYTSITILNANEFSLINNKLTRIIDSRLRDIFIYYSDECGYHTQIY